MNFRMPTIQGRMDRRVLVNFRVKSEFLERLLPTPFRPQIVAGWGLAGLCWIRLSNVRPKGLPPWCGLTSENLAHRIAVEWDEAGSTRTGVYIVRRDTDRWINHFAGGRLFSGEQHLSRFDVTERNGGLSLDLGSADGLAKTQLEGSPTRVLPPDSVFKSQEQASAFFRAGSIGWAAMRNGTALDGLTLHTDHWAMSLFQVHRVNAPWFTDGTRFPEGTIRLDSAFLMGGIEHEWRDSGRMPLGDRAQPPKTARKP
jgi:hypothetical protein